MIKPGKYRRPFDWRLSSPAKVDSGTAAEAFARLSLPENAEMFEDYLELTRKRRNNRTWLAKLQIHLLQELAQNEKAIKYYREKQGELERERRNTTLLPDSQEKEKHLKQLEVDLKVAEQELFFHRAHANCIRAIGDGIAWRSLGYDRAVMRALCQRASKQQILSEGIVEELREWSRTFDTGAGLAILNSLTNCLSIGDITIVRNDGTAEIVEVKSSKTKSSRVTRQKREMREVVKLLSSGTGALEGKKIEIQRFDIFPENGLSDLLLLLQEAEGPGWAARRLSNFIYIQCVDSRAIKDIETLEKELGASIERETDLWRQRNDLVVPMDSLAFIAFTPNCVPFSIFPFPAKICIDLLTGAKVYHSYINMSAVSREFENRGWRVKTRPEELLTNNRKLDDPVLIVRKGAFHPQIPPAYLTRMQMETLRPKVIIEEFEITYRQGPVGAPLYRFPVYDREGEIWD